MDLDASTELDQLELINRFSEEQDAIFSAIEDIAQEYIDNLDENDDVSHHIVERALDIFGFTTIAIIPESILAILLDYAESLLMSDV